MKNLLFVFIIIGIVSCSEEKIEPQFTSDTVKGEIPSHESWGTKIIFSDNGKTKAILFTDHLRKYDVEKVTLLDGVKIDFYDTTGRKASTLTSLKGKVDDATMNMYASDRVVAVNDSRTDVA